jgi:acyl-CoA synthetase (AMP-forming)/AMP-acid ligase II
MRVIDYFDKGVAADPARKLIVSDDGTYSYAEAADHSWRVAQALHAHGLQVGDGVGVLAPNVAEALLAMLGLWRAGGAWVPLNLRNTLDATLDFMNETACRFLFLHSRLAEDVDAIRAQVPTLERVVALDAPFAGADSMDAFLAAGADPLPDWGDPFGRPEAVCAMWPTGGTTGRSKAVVFTNQVWATLVELATRIWVDGARSVNLMVAPITHGAGLMAAIYASVGTTVVIRPGFDAEDVLDCIEREGVTHMFLPPTAYYALLEAQQSRPRDVSSLRMLLLAASPVSPERFGLGVTVFGPCVAQCWGQAEAPFVLTYLSPSEVASAVRDGREHVLASCGRATFSAQVAVMDDDGRLLGPAERGELVARGRLVTPGYLNRPDATAEVRGGGWHHTGDVGYVDEDGYVYIVDRKKDMIITGGFNVYPAEVEAAIMAMDGVQECAVIGVPDDVWGEAVTAVVVLANGNSLNGDTIIEASKRALGSVKAPKHVYLADSLPRTPVGKIDKRAIRAEFWEGLGRAVN